MTISLSLSSSGPCHFRLFQVIPSWAIWLCKSHIGPDQCQLSRCSTGTDRVTSEGYRRQEQLCSDTVFTSDSPLDTSVITSESQWHVVRLTEGPPANFTANPGTCTQGNAQFPWVSKATGTTIKKDQYWDEMSSGEQTCQHPPRECPCPLGALTQLTGEVGGGGCHPPPPGCPPTCLTYSHHLLRFAGQGFRTAHFLYQHSCGICFTWLPVACLLFSSVCDCRESVFWGKEEQNNAEFVSSLKCLKLQLTVVRFERGDSVCWKTAVIFATYSP